jgi:hypothetical protein
MQIACTAFCAAGTALFNKKRQVPEPRQQEVAQMFTERNSARQVTAGDEADAEQMRCRVMAR